MQAIAELHDTLSRSVDCEPGGRSMPLAPQCLPFQVSANPSVAAPFLNPTAPHAVAEVHDTEDSPLDVTPSGVAAARPVQLLPFHNSASGISCPPCPNVPTAMHAL